MHQKEYIPCFDISKQPVHFGRTDKIMHMLFPLFFSPRLHHEFLPLHNFLFTHQSPRLLHGEERTEWYICGTYFKLQVVMPWWIFVNLLNLGFLPLVIYSSVSQKNKETVFLVGFFFNWHMLFALQQTWTFWKVTKSIYGSEVKMDRHKYTIVYSCRTVIYEKI